MVVVTGLSSVGGVGVVLGGVRSWSLYLAVFQGNMLTLRQITTG